MFTASTDKQCKMWDLNSNQAIQVAQVIQMHFPHLSHITFDPLTLMGHQDRISPYNINTLPSRKVTKIKKIYKLGVYLVN